MRTHDLIFHYVFHSGVSTSFVRLDAADEFVEHVLESLEPRELLSAAMGTHAVLSPVVSSSWFVELAPSSYSAAGSSSLLSDSARVQSIEWEGQDVDVLTQQWVVQLTEQAIEQAGSAANVQTVLDLGSLGGRVIQGLGMEGLVLIETEADINQSQFVTALKSNDLVAAIEPNLVIRSQATPDDPRFSQTWGLHNTGGSSALADADIDAPEAWDITTGSSSVVVAVVDTGVDFMHPDLRVNMWVNPGETSSHSDSDGNGFIDDIYGYDFVNNTGTPMDDNGHGTHVAGTIGATGNNGQGVAGINWSVSIMALKFLDASGSGFISNAVRALNYATMMKTQFGVNVVLTNNSWGGGGYNSQMYNAIKASQQAGILFVAAAGNEGVNNDVAGSYPANYNLSNVISVAATDSRDQLASFSNYGANMVHIAAPGVAIRSTTPNNGYSSYSGTSMAAPHVSGVAALLWAQNPTLSYQQVKDAILSSADQKDSLTGKVSSGGRLNAYNALMQVYRGPSPDRYETNNSVSQVSALTAGGVNSANLGLLTEARTISSLNTNDGSADWFKFTMNDAGDSSNYIGISFDHNQGNLDLAVYRSDGATLVGQSTSSSDNESVSLNGEAAGTYYVRVWAPNSAQNSYNLTIDPGVDLGDAFESNDSRAAVDGKTEGGAYSPNLGALAGQRVITNLNTMDGTDDWFRFRLQNIASARHAVRIDFTHAIADLDMIVFRADGSVVGRSEGVSNTEVVSLDGMGRGVYYVQAYGYRGAQSPNYSLTFSTPEPAPDKAGNSPSAAMTVKKLKFKKPISDYVGEGDTADYFRVNLNKARQQLNLELVGKTGAASLRVINSQGQVMSEGITSAAGTSAVSSPLTRGTYFVVIEADASEQTDYDLRMGAQRMTRRQWSRLFAVNPTSQLEANSSAFSASRSSRAALAAMQATVPSTPTRFERMALVNVAGQTLASSDSGLGLVDSFSQTGVLDGVEASTGERILAAS